MESEQQQAGAQRPKHRLPETTQGVLNVIATSNNRTNLGRHGALCVRRDDIAGSENMWVYNNFLVLIFSGDHEAIMGLGHTPEHLIYPEVAAGLGDDVLMAQDCFGESTGESLGVVFATRCPDDGAWYACVPSGIDEVLVRNSKNFLLTPNEFREMVDERATGIFREFQEDREKIVAAGEDFSIYRKQELEYKDVKISLPIDADWEIAHKRVGDMMFRRIRISWPDEDGYTFDYPNLGYYAAFCKADNEYYIKYFMDDRLDIDHLVS